jgi:glyceraldehyde-3-phosphate dehydrogenase/erythrose-4-phosphate dehydrogenase
MAFRVPTTDVSVVDLTVKVAKKRHMKRLWQFKISFRNYHERSNGLHRRFSSISRLCSDKRTSIVDEMLVWILLSLKSYLGMIMNMDIQVNWLTYQCILLD